MNRFITWFAGNPVAANLLMIAILMGGTFAYLAQLDREFFPTTTSDTISVSVAYLGAGPEEVEDRIIIRVEEAVQDLDGIKKLLSTAREGIGTVNIQVQNGYDSRVLLDNVKARVDGINTFPGEAERPIISESTAQQRREMLLAIAGNVGDKTLKRWAERIRDEVAAKKDIDRADLQAVLPYEVAIEVPETNLRRFGISLGDVRRAIAANSLNLPAGSIKSDIGKVTLRTRGQAYNKADFEDIVVLQQTDGTIVRVGDIATVIDGFEEVNVIARMDGRPAVLMDVVSVSNPDVTRTSRIVKEYLEELEPRLPPGIDILILDDAADAFEDRMSLLLWNGLGGLALVFIVLMLFLRPAVATWVAIGIAIAFFGAVWSLPWFGISLNMISLFAFLLVLGIVVDDAIIVGEAIHSRNERGLRGLEAATRGAQRVSLPVFLAVLSTLIFFAPMFGVPGNWRQVAMNIPIVVFGALTFSLIESLLILPAHLRHLKPMPENPTGFMAFQQRFANGMRSFVQNKFRPFVELTLKWRGVTVLAFMLFFFLCVSVVAGGWIRMAFFPAIVADFVFAEVTLPENAPFSKSKTLQDRLELAVGVAKQEMEDRGLASVRNVMTFSNENTVSGWAIIDVNGGKPLDSKAFGDAWREALGPVPEAEEIQMSAQVNRFGKPIDIQISGTDLDELDSAIEAVKSELRSFNGVFDIRDSFSNPQREIILDLKPQAESLQLGLTDLAQQIREGYFGAEAQRIPRGKDDVRVMVRYPRETRESLESLSETRIRPGDGIEIPFDAVAEARYDDALTTIQRENRRRVAHVTASVAKDTEASEVMRKVFAEMGEEWSLRFDKTEIKTSGDSEDQAEFIMSLLVNLVFAVIAIYAILAVSFRSYGVPLVILTAIPFGFSGAVVGHLFLGLHISMFSILGIIAAAGVVVNDNLVLLDHLRRLRSEGMEVGEAIVQAACDRFRAIILTSLTTFVGLAPLMFETSMQAQFLIPMVVSLAFGVLFATGVTLLLVPCLYSLMRQTKHSVLDLLRRLFGRSDARTQPAE